jgi:hypothetical protein
MDYGLQKTQNRLQIWTYFSTGHRFYPIFRHKSCRICCGEAVIIFRGVTILPVGILCVWRRKKGWRRSTNVVGRRDSPCLNTLKCDEESSKSEHFGIDLSVKILMSDAIWLYRKRFLRWYVDSALDYLDCKTAEGCCEGASTCWKQVRAAWYYGLWSISIRGLWHSKRQSLMASLLGVMSSHHTSLFRQRSSRQMPFFKIRAAGVLFSLLPNKQNPIQNSSWDWAYVIWPTILLLRN